MQSNSALASPSPSTHQQIHLCTRALTTHFSIFFFFLTRILASLGPLNCPKCYCSRFFLWLRNSGSCLPCVPLEPSLIVLSFVLESSGFLPQLPLLTQCLFGFGGWTSRRLPEAFSHSPLVPSTAQPLTLQERR